MLILFTIPAFTHVKNTKKSFLKICTKNGQSGSVLQNKIKNMCVSQVSIQWLGSKINGKFSPLFCVLVLCLDWLDVCVKQMADLHVMQRMPKSGASCFC